MAARLDRLIGYRPRAARLACLLCAALLILQSGACMASGPRTGTESAATAASTADPSVTAETATAGSEGESSQAIDRRPQAASGTLRIWWKTRTTLNPLLETSRSGQAVNDLIFQGLFRINENQSVEAELAAGLKVREDGLQAIITLKPGLVFHDGQPLTAADVAACLQYVINPENHSIYASGLSAVGAVNMVDSQNLELLLNQPDPWLSYALTFPIIPAASLTAGPFDLVPGTGSYKMLSYDGQSGLELELAVSGDPSELKKIQVKAYRNESEAMGAFERDELDLVMLDDQEYGRYTLRSSLRLDYYTGNKAVFLSCNTQSSRPLASGDRLLFIKKLINAAALSKTEAAGWGEATDVGLPAASWLMNKISPDDTPVLDQLGTPAWNASSKPLSLLVPADDEWRLKLAGIIGSLLENAGIAYEQQTLAADVFWQTVTAGEYDLAILSASLPAAPVPDWLYKSPRAPLFSALDSINSQGSGLADYAAWQTKLSQLLPVSSEAASGMSAAGADLTQAILETAARSPWCCLMLMSEGLAYGDRVSGQCRPDRYHPYQNIEELWVWSGQSSSFS
ncbi:MAG: ABC transporter substrate-binding protein [Clostridiaceae bacterium]|nr:ABC transporter substrate-binding protein [Clostridiaceae bacterium]